jgi:hypothetical protein
VGFWETFVTVLLTSGVSTGLATFLIQRKYQHALDKKLEKHKSDLQKDVVEFSIKQSQLAEKRFLAAHEISKHTQSLRLLLLRSYGVFRVKSDDLESQNKFFQELINVFESLRESINDSQLLFPAVIFEKMSSLILKFAHQISVIEGIFFDETFDEGESKKYAIESISELRQQLIGEIKRESELLREDFQRIIGVITRELPAEDQAQ